MPKVEKLVAVGEIEKPCADSVQANFSTSRQEISTDVGVLDPAFPHHARAGSLPIES